MVESKDKERTTSRKGCITCGQEFDYAESVCPDDGTILTPLNEDRLVGTVLADRYEVLEVIGGGGMGLVYKARHRLMNRIVAIKTLHRHLISSAETLKRFQLEAQAASCLSLPNILTIYDFGLTGEGQPYMVMDYLEGTSLSDVIEQEGHLSVERFLNIFSQACAGLAHAHQKGVLHRDIKPSNIMLVNYDAQSDFVKIVDFGIAKILNQADPESNNLTKTGEVYGSPSFMSPEQCRGKQLDQRSDLYAMGCVMYRSVTGQNPHQGTDIIELLFKQVSEVPASFDTICPEYGLPEELERIIFKAIAKDPGQRYQTMGDLKDALDHLKEKLYAKPSDGVTPLWKRPGGTIAGAEKPPAPPPPVPHAASTSGERVSPNDLPSQAMPQFSTRNNQPQMSQSVPALQRETGSQSPPPREPITAHHAESSGANSAVRRSLARSVNLQQQKLMIGGIVVGVVGIFALVWFVAKNNRFSTQAPLQGESLPVTKAPIKQAPGQKMGIEDGLRTAMQALDRGDNQAASDAATQTLAAARAAGNQDAQVAQSELILGRACLNESKFAPAKEALQQAVALREKKFGRASKETAEALNYLGQALTGLGEFKAAEAILTEDATTKEKLYGPDNREVAGTLSSLGDLYAKQNRGADAQQTYTRALGILSKGSGKWDPAVAAVDLALANLYMQQKKYSDAQPLIKQALSIKQELLGSDSEEVQKVKTLQNEIAAKLGEKTTATGVTSPAETTEESATGTTGAAQTAGKTATGSTGPAQTTGKTASESTGAAQTAGKTATGTTGPAQAGGEAASGSTKAAQVGGETAGSTEDTDTRPTTVASNQGSKPEPRHTRHSHHSAHARAPSHRRAYSMYGY